MPRLTTFKTMAQAYSDFNALNSMQNRLEGMARRYEAMPIYFKDSIQEIKDSKVAVGEFAVSLTTNVIDELLGIK